MLALPHFSSRIIIGAGSAGIAVVAWKVACLMPGYPENPQVWPLRVFRKVLGDIQRQDKIAVGWIGAGVWSATVTLLHFGGLLFGIYPAVAWWDLLTHSMSGFGITAVLLLTHRTHVRMAGTIWWVLPVVVSIGAGFEVYEFLFKDFWHGWTLQQYSIDTIVDLGMNTVGAAVAAAIVNRYVLMSNQPKVNSSSPSHAD